MVKVKYPYMSITPDSDIGEKFLQNRIDEMKNLIAGLIKARNDIVKYMDETNTHDTSIDIRLDNLEENISLMTVKVDQLQRIIEESKKNS